MFLEADDVRSFHTVCLQYFGIKKNVALCGWLVWIIQREHLESYLIPGSFDSILCVRLCQNLSWNSWKVFFYEKCFSILIFYPQSNYSPQTSGKSCFNNAVISHLSLQKSFSALVFLGESKWFIPSWTKGWELCAKGFPPNECYWIIKWILGCPHQI